MTVTPERPLKRTLEYIKKDFAVQEELMCLFDPWHYQAIKKIVRFNEPYYLVEGNDKIPDEVTVLVTLEEWDETADYIMRTPVRSTSRTTVSLPTNSAVSKQQPKR